MAGKFKKDDYVLCPFYKKEDPITIRCEGLTNDSRLALQFTTKEKRVKYQDAFCRTNCYKKCKIHEMLMKKYEK